MSYADRLNQAMSALGVDTHSLAKHLGVSYQAVKKLMDGKSAEMTASNNAKAARYLGVDSDWLATGAGAMRPPAWPFSRVTRQQVDALSPTDLAAVEGAMLVALSGNLPATDSNVTYIIQTAAAPAAGKRVRGGIRAIKTSAEPRRAPPKNRPKPAGRG